MSARYSYGGDEQIFVEVDEAMSLSAFFTSLAITNAVREANIPGVTEICPANASFQIGYDPDVIRPEALMERLKDMESAAESAPSRIDARIIEIPVWYQDPYTHETLMRFRERHQDPSGSDLEYAARINGFSSVEEFCAAHAGSPWFVSMVGFVAGLPFLYQMVERSRQLEVPKYLRPRTDTPKLTIGHGGCFSCIYSVRGAGGYQMFGITPVPIFDPKQMQPYLREFMVLFRPGDIVKFTPVDRAGYDEILSEVNAERYTPKMADVTFDLDEFERDNDGTNRRLMEALS